VTDAEVIAEAEQGLTKRQREILDYLRVHRRCTFTGLRRRNEPRFSEGTAQALIEAGFAHWETYSVGFHSRTEYVLVLGGQTQPGFTGYENAEKLRAAGLS
jgi:hypothetical protein